MLARRLSEISEEKSEQLSWLEELVEVKVATIKLDLVWEPTTFMFCFACLPSKIQILSGMLPKLEPDFLTCVCYSSTSKLAPRRQVFLSPISFNFHIQLWLHNTMTLETFPQLCQNNTQVGLTGGNVPTSVVKLSALSLCTVRFSPRVFPSRRLYWPLFEVCLKPVK